MPRIYILCTATALMVMHLGEDNAALVSVCVGGWKIEVCHLVVLGGQGSRRKKFFEGSVIKMADNCRDILFCSRTSWPVSHHLVAEEHGRGQEALD